MLGPAQLKGGADGGDQHTCGKVPDQARQFPGQPRKVPAYKKSILQRISPEENPGKTYQQKGQAPLQAFDKESLVLYTRRANPGAVAGRLAKRLAERLNENRAAPFNNLEKPVQQSPKHKMPGRAVPQSANPKGYEQIQGRPPGSAAPQGDIQVVFEPGGQRNMPAPPEIPDGSGEIGVAKVDREIKAQDPGRADGYIRVAGKVDRSAMPLDMVIWDQ